MMLIKRNWIGMWLLLKVYVSIDGLDFFLIFFLGMVDGGNDVIPFVEDMSFLFQQYKELGNQLHVCFFSSSLKTHELIDFRKKIIPF